MTNSRPHHDPNKARDPAWGTETLQAKTERYHREVDTIPLEDRLYLDETGARLTMTPARGRSRRGKRVFDVKPVSPGTAVSTVAAVLTTEGLAGQWCYQGSLNERWFVAYLDVYLLPLLRTGKVLIMDNHRVHHARRVQQFLKRQGVRYLYLPPYSPELNPIEEAWSKFKGFLKRSKARSVSALLDAMNRASKTITSEDALGYFQHVEDFSLVIS